MTERDPVCAHFQRTLSAQGHNPVRARLQRYTAIPFVHAFSAIPRSRPCTPSALYRDPVRARFQRYTAIPFVHAFSAIPRSRSCTLSALYRDPVRARFQRYTAIPFVHAFSAIPRSRSCTLSATERDPNFKHWFMTSFLWRKVPESGAWSVSVILSVHAFSTYPVRTCF